MEHISEPKFSHSVLLGTKGSIFFFPTWGWILNKCGDQRGPKATPNSIYNTSDSHLVYLMNQNLYDCAYKLGKYPAFVSMLVSLHIDSI
jgi:hypothetical protein